ncbi:Annexin repeat [Dillenia turbinata]|uniref:Annexin repeat n=1 Tax=Dillenia turbinata TaxID=194707 RepID=A0AAN8ZGY0_9MAGN
MATIVAPLEHSAAEDAQAIREAVKGPGAMYRWIPEPADRDALLANIALRKGKFNHRVIVEVSCARHPEEFLAAKRAYISRYHHSLEEDVASHTTGALRKLVVALVGIYRYDGDEIDERLAESEAETLHYFIEENAFNHDEIIRIVSTRSKKQLLATINRYKHNYGISITKTLARIADNDVADALCAAIRCLTDQTKYYEKVLRHALHNRTDEDALTRVIVTQAERDLRQIKDLYYKRNSEPLEAAVAKETRGHYEDFLLALMGIQY